MADNQIISIIQSGNSFYTNIFINGFFHINIRKSKKIAIIDISSTNSHLFWSVYCVKNIKYLDDIFNVISDVNIEILKTYFENTNTVLCVKNTDIKDISEQKITYLLKYMSDIYDTVIIVMNESQCHDKRYILEFSDAVLLSSLSEPLSFEKNNNIMMCLTNNHYSDNIFHIMLDIGLKFDSDDIKGIKNIKQNLITVPFNLQIQHDIINPMFLFNDKNNQFVSSVERLIDANTLFLSDNNKEKPDNIEMDIEFYNEIKDRLHRDLIDIIKEEYPDESDKYRISKIIEKETDKLIKVYNIDINIRYKNKITKELIDDIAGLGVIEDFINDNEITEIMVNGCNNIYVEKNGRILETDVKFYDKEKIKTVIDRIASSVGRHIDEASPIVDARLADGSRVNAVITPVAIDGPVLTIRKFSKYKLTSGNLISYGSINADMIDFLKESVERKKNILISGGTGTGKTTLLNIVSSFISDKERIVTIEDSAELQLQQKHVVRLESRPKSIEATAEITIRQLVVNALRMRPDRIIVGECRSGETIDMLQAMNTGHQGSMTTVHANTPYDAVSRLAVMVLMSGIDFPEHSIISMITSAIDTIVQISRYPDGSRKISNISVIDKSDNGKDYKLLTLFEYNQHSSKFCSANKIPQGYFDK